MDGPIERKTNDLVVTSFPDESLLRYYVGFVSRPLVFHINEDPPKVLQWSPDLDRIDGKIKYQLIFLFTSFLMMSGELVQADSDKPHTLVIQVSTDDPRTQTIALNNAVNLQKHYGIDNVEIEIVAYGPGIGLVTANSKQKEWVESLALQDITFSACQNTLNKVEKRTGNKPKMLEGVESVAAGVVQIMELQEKGYAYLRP